MAAAFTASTEALFGGGRVVYVHGDVDLYAAPELKALLRDAVDRGDGRLAVDLTDTTALDSSALAALLSAYRRAQLLGGRVVLVNPNAHIAQTLAITGLDGILDVAASTEEARELLAS